MRVARLFPFADWPEKYPCSRYFIDHSSSRLVDFILKLALTCAASHKQNRHLSCIIYYFILGDPGAASRDDGIFMGESLQQERESPWALTLTERVPEAFEIPPSDWPEKYFSGQSAKRNSRATLMSSYTRLFSSSNAVVAWPVQREHF